MVYYLTGADRATLEAVLRGMYQAQLGRALAPDEDVPQHDGRIQFHVFFDDDPVAHAVLPRGSHAAIGVIANDANPAGAIGPQDSAALAAAGIDAKREDGVDATLLPKFQ